MTAKVRHKRAKRVTTGLNPEGDTCGFLVQADVTYVHRRQLGETQLKQGMHEALAEQKRISSLICSGEPQPVAYTLGRPRLVPMTAIAKHGELAKDLLRDPETCVLGSLAAMTARMKIHIVASTIGFQLQEETGQPVEASDRIFNHDQEAKRNAHERDTRDLGIKLICQFYL